MEIPQAYVESDTRATNSCTQYPDVSDEMCEMERQIHSNYEAPDQMCEIFLYLIVRFNGKRSPSNRLQTLIFDTDLISFSQFEMTAIQCRFAIQKYGLWLRCRYLIHNMRLTFDAVTLQVHRNFPFIRFASIRI